MRTSALRNREKDWPLENDRERTALAEANPSAISKSFHAPLKLLILGVLLAGVHWAVAQSFVLSSVLKVGHYPDVFTAADINGDGWVDLISPSEDSNVLTVLTNNGDGTFTVSSTNRIGKSSCVVAVDLNGDGKPDLVSANWTADALLVLTNAGNGTFTVFSTNKVGFGPWDVAVADINSDGTLDLITANRAFSSQTAGTTLTILTNIGNGTFDFSATLKVGSSPTSVVAADFNGDGKLDLVSANRDPNTLTVLTNNGSGGFNLSATLTVGTSPHVVEAADVNGDGWLDLITANTGDNTLTVLTNNANGRFRLSGTFKVRAGPFGVVAADLNGDGKPDLVSADSGEGVGNTLTVLTNNANGTFVRAATLGVANSPFYVLAADVDRDGKLDLICNTDNSLTVLLNSPAPPSLHIDSNPPMLVLSWSGAWPGFVLQQNPGLLSADWVRVTNAVETVAGKKQVLVELPREKNFYRLFHR